MKTISKQSRAEERRAAVEALRKKERGDQNRMKLSLPH
jgi:hypothetical protein